MKLARTPVPPIDIDELTRELREAALSSLPKKPKTHGDGSREMELEPSAPPESTAEAVDESVPAASQPTASDKPLRSIAGGLAHVPRPVARRAVRSEGTAAFPPDAETKPDLAAADLEASIRQILQSDPALSRGRSATSPAASEPSSPNEAVEATHGDDAWRPEAGTGTDTAAHWTEADLEVSEAHEAPPAAVVLPKRKAATPHALALSAALSLIALGVAAAVTMRVLPIGDLIARVQQSQDDPGKPASASADNASSPALSAVATADPQKPGDAAAPPASPSLQPSVPAPDPTTTPPAPAAATPGPASSTSADVGGQLRPSSGPAVDPAAPTPMLASGNPAADASQPAARMLALGAAKPVVTAAVKPDEGSDMAAPATGGPAAPAKADASPDATAQPDAPTMVVAPTPPARPAALERAKPSRVVVVDDRKTAKPARAPARVAAAATAPSQPPAAQPAPEPQPAGVPGFFHQVFGGQRAAPAASAPTDPAVPSRADDGRGASVASRAPAPQAAPPAGTTAIARTPAPDGGGVSVKLASSTSEEKAREALGRLRKQFPGPLSNAGVYREDLGKAGVFYRVRVMPLTRDAADKVCAELKAGGASCSISGG
jgi:hypothetical protein